MDDPKKLTRELQDIQWQIAAFIDKYTENKRDDDLAQMLRRAFGDLNDAKGIIIERAVKAGTMKMYRFGKEEYNPFDDEESQAS